MLLELIGMLFMGWNLVAINEPTDLDDPCIRAIWHWDAEEGEWSAWFSQPWVLAESGPDAGTLPEPGRVYWVYCE